MRVSQYYKLGLSQPSFEFLDIDIKKDTKVFVDPHAFKCIPDDWARECVGLIQDFFGEVLSCINRNDRARGLYLLDQLHESNEFHLGLSSDVSQGGGISSGLAEDLWNSLSRSKAVASGLIGDLEDTSLFIDGIGHDRISDATINIVRSQLIKFTQATCRLYNIPMFSGVDSGPMWDRKTKNWKHLHTELPIPNKTSEKLILVPKSVVRREGVFDPGKYLRNFVLPYLQNQHIYNESPLVKLRKDGSPYVTKKSITESDPMPTKRRNLETTLENIQLLDDFRKAKNFLEPLEHEDVAEATGTKPPDWDQLLKLVLDTPSGDKHATEYHHAVQALLTSLLYPALDMPTREDRIHEGRKRIDITYVNIATSGFFSWLVQIQKVSAGQIVVEAKNYTGELSNPEFDQLTGRFSPFRGQLGILCYRGFSDNKANVIKHCRDAALDQRGFVIALDDKDLVALVEARKDGEGTMFEYLHRRFRELI